MSQPSAFSALAMNCAPFDASRAAAVATAKTCLAPIWRASARKRFNAASARAIPPPPSLPLVATPRPRPQRIFSLKIGDGERRKPVIDDEADRVRADVDDGDRPVLRRLGPESLVPAHVFALAFFFERSMISGGTLPACELPRPESDGLFMK